MVVLTDIDKLVYTSRLWVRETWQSLWVMNQRHPGDDEIVYRATDPDWDSSLPGQNVLDLFGGSGSTMIGAEQTGRNAFLMELDCPYADVIVDRYQRFTGKQAILERTGESPIPMKPREENMR